MKAGIGRVALRALSATGVAAVLALGVTAASASATSYPTTVTAELTYIPPYNAGLVYCGPPCIPVVVYGGYWAIHGVVSSPEPACVSRRPVSVWRLQSGGAEEVRRGLADDEGNYSLFLTSSAPTGDYFVEAAAKTLAPGEWCEPARSGPVALTMPGAS